MPSAEYLQGLDQIKGLREVAARLAGGDSPACIAAGIEFVLEGLHLRNRLNKSTSEGGSRYARA
jgi:magnesium chelatase subunit I